MTMMPTFWGVYLIGFIVFYLFEIQDTEKLVTSTPAPSIAIDPRQVNGTIDKLQN